MRPTRTQDVHDRLRRLILDGATTLPAERTLANDLHVSRSTIRAAMRQLAQDGLLIRRPGRGTAIAPAGAARQAVRLLYPARHDISSGDTYLPALVESLVLHLGTTGRTLLLDRRAPGEMLQLASLADLRAGGVIVVGSPEDQDSLGRLHAAGIPIVVIGDPQVPGPAPVIGGDHGAAITAACTMLAGLGHRRIALADGPVSDPYACHRRAAYRTWMSATGSGAIEIPLVGWETLSGSNAARMLLAMAEPPTAVMAYGDYATVGLVTTLRGHGIMLPRDLSLVALDHRTWIDRVLGLDLLGWYESPEVVARAALAVIEAQLAGLPPPCGPGSVAFTCRPGSSVGPVRSGSAGWPAVPRPL